MKTSIIKLSGMYLEQLNEGDHQDIFFALIQVVRPLQEPAAEVRRAGGQDEAEGVRRERGRRQRCNKLEPDDPPRSSFKNVLQMQLETHISYVLVDGLKSHPVQG